MKDDDPRHPDIRREEARLEAARERYEEEVERHELCHNARAGVEDEDAVFWSGGVISSDGRFLAWALSSGRRRRDRGGPSTLVRGWR